MSRLRLFLALFSALVLAQPERALLAAEREVEFSVNGGGFWRNRAIKAQLTTLFAEDKDHLEASDIEDAALIALSSLQSEGYLNARTNAEISTLGGEVATGEWDKSFSFFLPRDLKADSVEFELVLGPRFFFESLEIGGDHSLEREEIESFFFAESFLLESEKDRVFTKSGLSAGIGNLESYLKQLGFLNAKTSGGIARQNEESGSVDAFVNVEQGEAHVVESIVIESEQIDQLVAIDVGSYRGRRFSRFVMQDIGKALRNRYFEAGYPDTSVKSSYEVSGKRGDEVLVTIKVVVEPGERKTVGSIVFSGQEETRQRLMERQLKLAEGDPLNPVALEESRVELSRLGVFRKVDYELSEASEGVSDLKFLLEERYPWTVDMILGWGSYENLRGGVIAERRNLFGKAHRARFKGFASMKSLLADARYLVPDLWNSDTALTSKLFVLNREEASFEREELGFDIGLSKYIKEIDMDGDLVYTLQTLEPRKNELGGGLGNQDSKEVGSLELRLGRDRRDNPLSPRDGYRTFGRFEWASKSMGGESDFRRVEVGYSQHGKVSNGLLWHFGLTHGGIASFSALEDPANKLFFLGGENSIRGYRRGEASPKDEEGLDTGARSYALLNLELEQLLSDSLSVVLFGDALGQTALRYDYDFDEYLYSVGLGLRIRTFMGPVRFEYGRNVNPRLGDSDGAFHFSIGYPF